MSKQKSRKRTVVFTITATTDTDFKQKFISDSLYNLVLELEKGLYGKANKIDLEIDANFLGCINISWFAFCIFFVYLFLKNQLDFKTC